MLSNTAWFDFLLTEWLLFASAAGLAATSLYLDKPPTFSLSEIQVLFLLWVLFVTVKGLQNTGLILRFSQSIEKGRWLPLKLVVATFVLSMIVTNDIALIVIVPLTLSLNTDQKDILVILEALAANAGSALTPFGNPQNLFIYWFYHIAPTDFVAAIAPFSIVFFVLLLIGSAVVKISNNRDHEIKIIKIKYSVYIYGAFLLIIILSVFRIIPIYIGIIVILYCIIFDRKNLNVDYGLLFTFLFFFGLSENIKIMLASNLKYSEHIFILSALSSQVVGNVPAALLFAKFTTQWKMLLWGTNVGGFGNIMASFANLIAYKFYIRHERGNKIALFTIKFICLGYLMFFLGIGLYFFMES